jgi:hypothetical protein
MTYQRGDVVLIPFPFTDLTARKRRPVLLLSDPDAYGDFLAIAITSQPGHTDAIALDSSDFQHGVLPKPSWLRSRVGCNKHSALHLPSPHKTSGAMPFGYCALRAVSGRKPCTACR